MGDGIWDLEAAYGRCLPFYHPGGLAASLLSYPANGSAVFQGGLCAINSLDLERWFADFKFDNEGFEEPIHS
jgi:hypothetical protein